MSINYNENRGYQSSIPKPVIEALGEPKTITFVLSGNNVKILSTDSKHKSGS